jgi:hypothetical protein
MTDIVKKVEPLAEAAVTKGPAPGAGPFQEAIDLKS